MINKQTESHMGDILIVDDDRPSLSTLSSMLTAEGYEVRDVRDGQTALAVIENNPPELILLDLKTHGIKGLELFRQIQADEKSSDIPILFLSAIEDLEDKVKGFTAGAVDFITKPFQAEEVLARVDTHIKLRRLSRNLEQQIEERTAELEKREERLRMMKFTVDHATDRIAWIAPDGRFLYANIAGYSEMNFSLEQVLSMRVSDIDPKYPQEKWNEHFRELKKEGVMRLQTQQIDGEGQKRYIDVHSKYIKFGDNEFICSFGRDITELKMIQEALSEQLEFERMIADIATKCAQMEPEHLDAEINETLQALGRFLRTERAFLAQFSEDGSSLNFTNMWAKEGTSLFSQIFEIDLAAELPWFTQQIRNGDVINAGLNLTGLPFEAKKLRKWLERDGINSSVVVPVRVGGRSIGMLGLDTLVQPREYPQTIIDRLNILADMIGSTLQRFRSQIKLQKYQHIVEATTSIVGMVDPDYVYQYVNDAYCVAFKKNRPQIIDHTVAELFGQEIFNQTLKSQYERCFNGEEVSFQSWFDLPGWGHRFMDVRFSPFFDSDRKVSAVVVSAHDITEVKQLGMKLQESEGRFQAFMDNIPAAVYIKDEKDRHLYGNREALESVKKKKLEEFIGLTTQDLWPPQLADRLIALDRKVVNEDTPRIAEEWQNTAEGDTRWRRDIKFPIRLAAGKKLLGGIALDITDIKQNEQNLRNAYKEIEQLKEKLEQENIYLREEIEVNYRHEEIVGKSEPVMEMLSRAEQVAKTNSTVLILGETGTGKELLARSIHKLSRRKDRQMIKVNCAALPPTLIESELFGREKGAYTGAMTRQIGRFEIADKSTIFLDEIGELPLGVQAKLLRVLQEGQFERLGNPKTLSVNVRIIASTNRDLARTVANGRFREDLYYRLNVFSITVPPLRDRAEDIPLLLWTFVKEFEKSMGKTIEKIPQKSIDALQQYSWPGNIRELRNVVENAMIISTGKILKLIPPVEQFLNVAKDLKLEVVERNHILGVLEKTSWRVSGERGAAKLLGLKPTTLESRMKKLGIVRPK